MEENTNLQEFESELDLDAILREFGAEPPVEPDPESDSEQEPVIPANDEPEEPDAKIWEPSRKNTDFSAETVRLNSVHEAVCSAEEPVSDYTVVFKPENQTFGEDTVVFSPQKDPSDPFRESWIPEYRPQKPIVFRPKNRLRELRQKLVAGPEQRFYALSELGLGKLQAAIFLGVLVFVLCAGSTVLYALNMVAANRVKLVIFWQGLAMLVSALLGIYRIMEGIGDLFHGRFTLKTLLVFTLIACAIDTAICLRALRLPCCAVFCLEMLMVQWAQFHQRSTEISMMDTLRKATDLFSVVRVDDLHDGVPGYSTAEGHVEDFMDNYSKTATPERLLQLYALAALVVSAGLGVAAGIRSGWETGIRAVTAALLVSMPATGFISMSRPMAILEKRLHKLGSVLCGWQGIQGEKKNALFPVSQEDLFPAGSVKFNGVKFYGYMNPDTVVAYAASLMAEDENALSPLFEQLLSERNGYHFHVEEFHTYESGGIGGEIGGESVLAGSLRFMRDMGVDMPEGTRVAQAVYLSVGGTLSGVFALSYGKSKNGGAGLRALCDSKKLIPILTSGDFNLTESFLRAKYKVNTHHMVFPTAEARHAIGNKEVPEEDATVVAMTVREGLAQRAFAITGARALRSSLYCGMAVHLFGGILGLLMVGVLSLMGATDLLTPESLLLYSAVWAVPGWLITEWTRYL